VDECAAETSPCTGQTRCQNTTGSYQCPSTIAEITSLKLAAASNPVLAADAEATLDGGTDLAIVLPYGTDVDGLTDLRPTIAVSAGAAVSPPSGAPQDFSGGAVAYVVTAEDGQATRTYRVSVTIEAPSSAALIVAFVFEAASNSALQADAAGIVSQADRTVAVAVPTGTDVTALAPAIALSAGATISPAGGAAWDFSAPATYTVTAQDGVTTADYVVTVTVQ